MFIRSPAGPATPASTSRSGFNGPLDATPPAGPDVPDPFDLVGAFMRHLQPQIARTPPQQREVFRLRHQVYCEELGFEAPQPRGEESDDFDARALHGTVRHRRSGVLAGTVRLVGKHSAAEGLPLERHCAHALTHPHLRPDRFEPSQVCEISRLAVPGGFRRRSTDALADAGIAGGFSEDEWRSFPNIAIGLYMVAIALSHHTRRYHLFVMMEPRLARALGHVGIRAQALGAPVEYHGRRGAYYVDSRQLPGQLEPVYRDLLQTIDECLFGPLSTRPLPDFWSS